MSLMFFKLYIFQFIHFPNPFSIHISLVTAHRWWWKHSTYLCTVYYYIYVSYCGFRNIFRIHTNVIYIHVHIYMCVDAMLTGWESVLAYSIISLSIDVLCRFILLGMGRYAYNIITMFYEQLCCMVVIVCVCVWCIQPIAKQSTKNNYNKPNNPFIWWGPCFYGIVSITHPKQDTMFCVAVCCWYHGSAARV